MYAGGKYNNNDGGNYDYALGLNGLGLCATQYASEYMDADHLAATASAIRCTLSTVRTSAD